MAALLFSIGLIQVAAYYLSAALVNGPGALATPQPDTLLYCQAARRIAEGHAFSFSAGSAVSTGTTSVLYPFALAVPYLLGFTCGSLLTAGFWLNAACYLIFLGGWARAFRCWSDSRTAAFAVLLLAVFPQTAYVALAQSDMGLWMAVSGLLAAALAADSMIPLAVLLCLGPWVRPEGMVAVTAFVMIAACRRRVRDLVPAVLAVISVLAVFAFNRYLTGAGGFSSVAAKGYFSTQSFCEALRSTVVSGVSMANDLVFGRAGSYPRGLYAIPLVGSIALIIGVGVYAWGACAWSLAVMMLAAAGGFLVVAQSGWEGTNTDRYLAWLMPIIVFFSAVGWRYCRERLSAFPWARFLLIAPVAYSVGAAGVLVGVYHLACRQTEVMVRYAQEIDRIIPANASVATSQFVGMAYYWGDRHAAHLSGIYSPEFTSRNGCGVLEALKHEPDLRFDYWLYSVPDMLPPTVSEACSSPVLSGPEARVLKKMDWSVFDNAAKTPVVEGKELKCRVDVRYDKDEKAAGYEVVTSYGMDEFEPLIEVSEVDGLKIVDAGRLVAGYDEMTVTGLTPGKDLTVVMRLAGHAVAVYKNCFDELFKAEYSFLGENGLHLAVDGVDAVCTHVKLEGKGLADRQVTIPAKWVTADTHRIRFHGDHAVFDYWFYQ